MTATDFRMCILAVGLLVAATAGAASSSYTGAPWERVGPRNIFDDDHGNGEAGTLADAASPAGRPHVIYTGAVVCLCVRRVLVHECVSSTMPAVRELVGSERMKAVLSSCNSDVAA